MTLQVGDSQHGSLLARNIVIRDYMKYSTLMHEELGKVVLNSSFKHSVV